MLALTRKEKEKTDCRRHLLGMEERVPTFFKYPYVESTCWINQRWDESGSADKDRK
jgi:hypothetical protein